MIGSKSLTVVAAILGLFAVGIGAMGSHSLPERLRKQGFEETRVVKKLEQCEIAVKYHLTHALAILALGLAPSSRFHRGMRIAGGLFLAGVVLFAGGLYSMVFLDRIGHWSIVPLGGSVLMLGWLTLAVSILFVRNSAEVTGK
jgi:uncharacterized membrane protein YgdD (TMEM256/DUF423 family)